MRGRFCCGCSACLAISLGGQCKNAGAVAGLYGSLKRVEPVHAQSMSSCCAMLPCCATLCCAGLLPAMGTAAGELGPFIKRHRILAGGTPGGPDTVSSCCQREWLHLSRPVVPAFLVCGLGESTHAKEDVLLCCLSCVLPACLPARH